jgi:S-adenosylmethionine:diacylglycerol 3-amino-3-carboxypropyl transferase
MRDGVEVLMTTQEALESLKDIKDQIDRLEVLKADISEFLAEAPKEEMWFVDKDGQRWTATATASDRVSVNMSMLRRLDPGLASSITKEVVDTELLRESLDQGRWRAEIRDLVVTITKSRPGVRFAKSNPTTKENSDATPESA